MNLLNLPEDQPEPRDGFLRPCLIDDHEWELEIEEGTIRLHAKNPHPDEDVAQMDANLGDPVCRFPYWEKDDIFMPNRVPVKVRHVDDSTSSTPNGPAEYGFYLEVEL